MWVVGMGGGGDGGGGVMTAGTTCMGAADKASRRQGRAGGRGG